MITFELGPVDIINYDGLDYKEAANIITAHCTHRFKRVRITHGEFVFHKLRRLVRGFKTDCNIVYFDDNNNPGFDDFIRHLPPGGYGAVKASDSVRRDIPACETKRWLNRLFSNDVEYDVLGKKVAERLLDDTIGIVVIRRRGLSL